ncbi:MAG: hypothetical protein HQK98_06390 [Nitrospirae bacterium]|nr:hypothetical protein [Nitrospirota bacterium]
MMKRSPKDIREAAKQLDFKIPLEEGNPCYVDTEKGRGGVFYNQLYKKMGFDISTFPNVSLPERGHTLFCGHVGCGKSTVLRRLKIELNKRGLFYVVFIDVLEVLDINNLQYPDLLMALANNLLQQLKDDEIEVDSGSMKKLQSWFKEKIITNEKVKSFAMEMKTVLNAVAGISSLTKIFGKIVNSFKIGTTDKEELRQVIVNHFSEFADAFHELIAAVESEVGKKNLGLKILFIVDGTDKMSKDDSRRFFIEDSNQLKSVKANFLYGAPIHLFYSDVQVRQSFDHFMLPMIKIADRDEAKNRDGYEIMRKIVLLRADISLFDNPGTFEIPGTIDKIIEYSGGSPRELIRILKNAYSYATDKFTEEAVMKGINSIAMDYERMLLPKGPRYYELLHNIDNGRGVGEHSDIIEDLLFNLAMFEYNDNVGLFWRANPVVRLLENYRTALGSDKDK